MRPWVHMLLCRPLLLPCARAHPAPCTRSRAPTPGTLLLPLPHLQAEDAADKRVTFQRYAGSYARERPVALTMIIMAAHTLAFWVLFSAPIDTLFKVGWEAFL